MDFYASIQGNKKDEIIKLSKIEECESPERNQNMKLQEQNASLRETVTALSQNCQKADEMMRQQAQLHAKAAAQLQQHNVSLKETMDALSLSCKANEDKILLQKQLHSDQLQTLRSSDNTLKERCQSLAAFAEQHRLTSLRHEEKHKGLTQELQSMAKVQMQSEAASIEFKRLQSSIKTRDRETQILNDNLQSLQNNIETLQCSMQSLKQEHETAIKTLGQKLEVASAKLQSAHTLLKASPDSNNHNSITKHTLKSLKSSVEVMQLAYAHGSSDSM